MRASLPLPLGVAAGAAAGSAATSLVLLPHARRRQARESVALQETRALAAASAAQGAVRRGWLLPHAHSQLLLQAGAMTREELGRCTWTLLHTLAAAFPEQPTRRQQRDACELVRQARLLRLPTRLTAVQILVLSRVFPCRECATHFAELIRHVSSPVPPA